jgi:uncharacterized RDD family membrane protein YckC
MKSSANNPLLRQALAAAIDFVALSALAALISVATYAPSGGHVRSSTPTWTARACEPQGEASNCRLAIFGWEVDRVRLTTVRKARMPHAAGRFSGDGSGIVNVTAAIPLDRSGEPTSAFYVDWIEGAVAIVVLAALRSFLGGTLGDWLIGMTLVSLDGARPRLGSALTRNIMVWGWWVVLGVLATQPPPILPDMPRGPEVGFLAYALAVIWIASVITAEAAMESSPIDALSQTRIVLRRRRVAPSR